MTNIVEELSTKIAHQKASMIDAHLARFLTEQGFNCSEWTVSAMKEELQKGGFEIIHEYRPYSESEVHTFKLAKIYAKSSLTIPMPELTIKHE